MSMTFSPRLVFAVGIFLLVDCGLIAQSPQSGEKLAEQAQREFLAGRFRDAELDFRGLTKLNPSDIVAQLYLGHSLFRQEKYTEAGQAYEKARDLEKTGNKLSLDQHRILTDERLTVEILPVPSRKATRQLSCCFPALMTVLLPVF